MPRGVLLGTFAAMLDPTYAAGAKARTLAVLLALQLGACAAEDVARDDEAALESESEFGEAEARENPLWWLEILFGRRDAGTTTPRDAGSAQDAGVVPPTPDAAVGNGIDLEVLRQVCVDEINGYRATVNLPPLTRPEAAVETCSDDGARIDSSSGAHASAGRCFPRKATAQNSCPNWPVRGAGTDAVAATLKQCLKGMWGEGAPAVGRAACMRDLAGCYYKHGHYLNMTAPEMRQVACGFYKTPSGAWYLNQDFGS